MQYNDVATKLKEERDKVHEAKMALMKKNIVPQVISTGVTLKKIRKEMDEIKYTAQ